MEFNFEEIGTSMSSPYRLRIYHETTTDCLFIQYQESGGLTQMLDPGTGKPLTYANWCEKYKNRNDNL